MKLNLLPTTEKKSRQGKTAIVVAALIVLASIGGYAALTFIPATALNQAKAEIGDLPQQVANLKAQSDAADTIIASASDVIRNAQLAKAMVDHNDVYPKLYDDVKRYIPPYYRVQSMTASPSQQDPTKATLTIDGTLTGYQRYADLMLALMRFKDAETIERQGYNLDDPQVPALNLTDQTGKMRKVEEAPVPDDQLERLAYFQQQAASAPTGYLNQGSFGSGTTDLRGPLPNASIVRIQMLVNRNLQVPLPATTLQSGGGGATAGPGGPGFGPGGPGGSFGPPGVPPGFGGGGRPGAGGRPD